MQSTSLYQARPPAGLHVAVIMDGNGRWAEARGLTRVAGHRAGADAVRRAVEAAPTLGISTLSLFAFSADNWTRSPVEVRALMELFLAYLRAEAPALAANGVRLRVIGRRDRLSLTLREAIARAEGRTAAGPALLLRVAIDYSAREAIVRAAPGAEVADREAFRRRLGHAYGEREPAPDVDLLIRTGGEQRLSDFLLWECAYAELYFTAQPWPDFDAAALAAAVGAFQRRERRFGRVPSEAAP
jgi:undecaprenyl diphosphate synthase